MVRRSVFIFGLSTVVVALGLAAVTLLVTRNRESGDASSRTVTTGTAAIGGPFTLVDTTGKTVTDQTFRGKWLLIYFGYTFCPDACPIALTKMGDALSGLGPLADKLKPLFITVDPKRDTVQVMADYLKSFDPRIVGLTGSQAQTDSVVKTYRVYVAPQNTGGSDYPVNHSAYFYVMDPAGRFVDVIAPDVSADEMANRLRKVFAE